MIAYIVRRILYAVPIVVGVNILVFLLFFLVNSPDNMARNLLGGKNVTPEAIENWKRQHGYHLPLFYNNGTDVVTRYEPNLVPGEVWDGSELKLPAGRYHLDIESKTHRATVGTIGVFAIPVPVPAGSATQEANSGLEEELAARADGVLTPRPLSALDPALSAGLVGGEGQALTPDTTPLEGASMVAGMLLPYTESRSVHLILDLPANARTIPGYEAPAGTDANTGWVYKIVMAMTISDDRPVRLEARLWQRREIHGWSRFTETIFWHKGVSLFRFDFGRSDRENDSIGRQIGERMWYSLAITVPIFILALFLDIVLAMILAYFRGTYIDFWGVVLCVVLMSISTLFYIIGGQWLLSIQYKLIPISGFLTEDVGPVSVPVVKFLVLPVVIGIMAGLGRAVRFNRTIFLEEMTKDYVRTARAKGLPERVVLFKHALKNALIPILTSAVLQIPFLFMGSLLLENFFAIPGLGSYTIDAIHNQDFAVVRAMVYIGSLLYIVGLILTDISYTIVDPRIKFE